VKSNLDGVWVGDMQGQQKAMLVLSVSDKQNIVGKYSVIATTGSGVSCEDGLISGQKTSESRFVFQVASVPGGGCPAISGTGTLIFDRNSNIKSIFIKQRSPDFEYTDRYYIKLKR